ncbi:rhodanese-like domain-containing protein [Streptomyces griseofuscus]|uniref:rhodanese-like domain-containing protein n=1 Tax=Streptomyces TaxID=1883 RepID=UPI001601819A|nr:rhodanese-like domain-containing protein [Streptomyces murinus]MBA9050027.1 rhodanese-related sulfurtransferase [Streptomyces murinus]
MSPLPRDEDRVSVAEAVRHTRGTGAPAVLLDVRERHEWDAGHALLSGLVTGAALLTGRGARAVDVEGGTRAWAVAGHPVVDVRGNSGSIA